MMKRHSIQEEETLGKIYDHRLVKRLMIYQKPYKFKIVVSILLLISIAGLEQVGPWLSKVAVDDHILQKDFPGLLRIVGIFALVAIITTILKVVQTILTSWVGEKVMLDLRREIFTHVHEKLETHEADAAEWRDTCVEYFATFSGMSVPEF